MDNLVGGMCSNHNLSKEALFLFNMVYHDSLMQSLRAIAERAGVDPDGQRREILSNLLQKISGMDESEVIQLTVFAYFSILKFHRKQSRLFSGAYYRLAADAEPIIYTYNTCLEVLRSLEFKFSRPLDLIYHPGLPPEFSKLRLTPQRVLVKQILSNNDLGDFDSQLRYISPEHRLLVCCNPDSYGIPGIQYVQKSNPDTSSCACIHCYLRSAFPRNAVRKVLAVHGPSTSNRIPKSFTLTMEEYQKIRNDSYRLSLVLLNRIGDSWVICGDRPRIWLNRVDINYIQHLVTCREYNLKEAANHGKNILSTGPMPELPTYIVVYLYELQTKRSFIERIINKSKFTLDSDKAAIVAMMNGDEDVGTMEFRFSLLDPLTYLRMEHPVRSRTCKHINCFDLQGFIDMYMDKDICKCPVCNEVIRMSDLVEDQYILSILKETTEDEDEVELDRDGSWKHCPLDDHPLSDNDNSNDNNNNNNNNNNNDVFSTTIRNDGNQRGQRDWSGINSSTNTRSITLPDWMTTPISPSVIPPIFTSTSSNSSLSQASSSTTFTSSRRPGDNSSLSSQPKRSRQRNSLGGSITDYFHRSSTNTVTNNALNTVTNNAINNAIRTETPPRSLAESFITQLNQLCNGNFNQTQRLNRNELPLQQQQPQPNTSTGDIIDLCDDSSDDSPRRSIHSNQSLQLPNLSTSSGETRHMNTYLNRNNHWSSCMEEEEEDEEEEEEEEDNSYTSDYNYNNKRNWYEEDEENTNGSKISDNDSCSIISISDDSTYFVC